MDYPRTLHELKAAQYQTLSVKDELRLNLIRKLRAGEKLFPGIVGYEDTVIPQIVNAVLSRHNIILLGLRGQAKSRIIRQLTNLLDERIPIIAGSEVNDDPFRPISAYGRQMLMQNGDSTPINWIDRDSRFVEKLATPDVTVADIIGDVDPIKAAKGGHLLSDELTIHFGLLPRANRGVFAINELPDLAGKIQVALFNIMQEGDVQIKGYPVRLPLDVMLVFSANPEDYTARGKIITPLKDRIGSEIMTHYAKEIQTAVEITKQEAWTSRFADRERVHLVSSLVSVYRFQVAHMPHNRIIAGDSVCAEDAARRARAFEGHRDIVHFRHGNVHGFQLSRILHPSESQGDELRLADLGQHFHQFLLRQLKPSNRPIELDTLFRILDGRLITGDRRAYSAPRDAIARLRQTHKRALQAAACGQNVLFGKQTVLEHQFRGH